MADRYWIATTAQSFNNSTYWSTTSGGSGGASVPGLSDKAIFDSNGSGDCSVSSDWTLQDFDSENYTGTITVTGKRTNFRTTGGSIFRLGADVTCGDIEIGTVTNVYIDGTTSEVIIDGDCTLHTLNETILYAGNFSVATTINIGEGPITTTGGRWGHTGTAALTVDNSTYSTPIYVKNISEIKSTTSWDTSTVIYPKSDSALVSLIYSSAVGPIIIDPDNFTGSSNQFVQLRDNLTCEYIRDCYGLLANNAAYPITETGTDSFTCRDIVTVGASTVVQL